MKHLKKTFAILLALVMILCAVPTAAAYVHPVEGADMTVDWDGVLRALRPIKLDPAGTVDLSAFNIPNTQANQDLLFQNAFYGLPELFGSILRYKSVNGTITEATLQSPNNYNNYIRYIRQYNACMTAMDSILYGIRDNDALSDADKCLLVHDRLAAWCAYNYEDYLAHTIPSESITAYGPLAFRTGICSGISFAYKWMMDQLGIECAVVDSAQLNHAWNEVWLDGEPYFVDVTWDDPVWDVPGRVNHGNCLQSYATFSTTHAATDYDTAPTSTLYDNYFSKNVESEIVLIDNTMYFLGNGAKLYARTPDGTITYLRQMDNAVSYQEGNTTYTTYPSGRKIIAVGDEILYLAPKDVQAYNVKTGALRTAYTPSKSFFPTSKYYLYGIQLRDGVVYVTANDSGNFGGDTLKQHTESFVYCTHTTTVPCRAATHSASCKTPSDETTICPTCRKTFQSTALDPENHLFTADVEATDPDCYHVGYTAGEQCTGCQAFLSGHEELPISHVIEIRDAREATCTNTGYTGTEYCTRCQQRIAVGQHQDALGHLDPDANGNCPRCGMHIVDDPDPVDPQPQTTDTCKWCGGTHGGAFGWLVRIFHNLFAAIFGAKY